MPSRPSDYVNEQPPPVVRLASERFADARGESIVPFRNSDIPFACRQVVVSTTRANALRGLHLHARQWDAWCLIDGHIEVALVDLRIEERISVEFFAWGSGDPSILVIPPGVAHGYLALDEAKVLYMLSHEYDPTDEFGIRWNDDQLDLPWSSQDPILSERDAGNPDLSWESLPSFTEGQGIEGA